MVRSFFVFFSTLLLLISTIIVADDIEIYVGDLSFRQGQKPQVLIIFDNSGSMRTTLQVKPDYDPNFDYASRTIKVPDSTYYYFIIGVGVDSSLPNPDLAQNDQRFFQTKNTCASANQKLNTVGYFTGHLREYRFSGNTGSWQTFTQESNAANIDIVECWEDTLVEETDNLAVLLPNGSPAPTGYPIDGAGSQSTPVYFTSDPAAVNPSFASGEVVTLFTANYLRWYHANDLGTISKSRLSVAQQTTTELLSSAPALDFGLMVFNLNAFGEFRRDGGRIVSGIGSNNTEIINTIDSVEAETNTPLCESLYEAYRYFSGDNVVFGTADSNTSWWSGGRRINYIANTPPRDLTAENNGKYLSPFRDLQQGGVTIKRCATNVNIILITDGKPTSDSATNQLIQTLNPQGEIVSNSHLASLAQWLHNNDIYGDESDGEQNATTFTIGFGKDAIDNAGVLLSRTAELGGGQYFAAEDAVALQRSLQVAIGEILKVSSSFNAPAVASNLFDRTRSLASVYFTMFLPEQGPKWSGNLKKLNVVNEQLVDTKGLPAINSLGNIADKATTIWSDIQDPDGNDVQKGGVQTMLANKTERTLYTDVGTGTPLPSFNKANLVAHAGSESSLATIMNLTTEQLNDYLSWSQGIDVDDADGDSSHTDNRLDIFGDPLHSRPAVINYGPKESPDIRILLGTNHGVVHFFKDKGNSVDESWAFMPYELISNIKEIKENFPGVGKVYGMDGSPTLYQIDKNNNGIIETSQGDKVWAFIGMRRGGSSYYAFDLTQPDSPKLMWTLSATDIGFSELGQTWSKPQVGFIPGHTGGQGEHKPVLIFGGGYAVSKDNITPTSDNVGRAIYIVDAETKQLVWSLTPATNSAINTQWLGIEDSIPASITPLDSDNDGLIDRLYAPDTGGNIWRIDLPSSNRSDWDVFPIAVLGGDGDHDRRFFNEIIIARTYLDKVTIIEPGINQRIVRKTVPFDALAIGSGNRPKPTATAAQDHLFLLRDFHSMPYQKDDSRPEPIVIDNLINLTLNPLQDVTDIEQWNIEEALFSSQFGWYYPLSVAEKSLSAGLVLGGVVYFTSFIPADLVSGNQCLLQAGSGQLYAFNLNFGLRVFQQNTIDLGDKIPDTLELFLGQDANGNSKISLIGVGKGKNNSGLIDPPIACTNASECLELKKRCNETGQCSAVDENLGLKTTREYIYLKEQGVGN